MILVGKHPAYVSFIESKIIDKNDHRISRKQYVLSFDIDTRNYQHVKKAFKQIKEEWSSIDYIFHFDEYFTNKPIQEMPINNFKYLQQWNQFTFFNILKAHQLFIKTPVRILTLNTKNKKTLYYHIKNSINNFIKENYQNITILELSDSIFLQIHKKKITMQSLKESIIGKQQTETILYDFLKNKRIINI